MNNPFNITFGEKPFLFVPRSSELVEIENSFDSEVSDSKIYIVTGPRGCGKTVAITDAKKHFQTKDNWICVDLNPFSDMHEQLASKIIEQGKLKKLFIKQEFSFSFQGFGISIKGDNPVSSVFSLLDIIFNYLKKKKIKVLITIDDIASGDEIKKFAYSFQSFLREEYLCYLLMSGLYENVSDLTNDKNLTFLLRAPKIELTKLNTRQMAFNYQNHLNLDETTALELAKITKGYAYGYQLLGNLMFKHNAKEITDRILQEFDILLEENVYDKIWSSLSKKEQKIVVSIANSGEGKTKEILDLAGMNNNEYQVYKRKLGKIGIVDDDSYGVISFSLPRFKEFVKYKDSMNS